MSLQSGSTVTLRRMRRPYSAEQYAALAGELRTAIPGLALTTDVIVGFPGETEAEFAESLAFVERLAFARAHVFTYSPRVGTHAATLPDQVPPERKKARVQTMLEAGRASERRFWQRYLGETLEVAWEERKAVGSQRLWSGLTDNYIRVFADCDRDLGGSLEPARLTRLSERGILGILA